MLNLIALGANLDGPEGDPRAAVTWGFNELDERGHRVVARSRLYSSPAWPQGSGPDFVNAAAVLRTDLDPDQLLSALKAIEADFGRKQSRRWQPRVLDLDLLAVEQQVLPDAQTQDQWRNLPDQGQHGDAPGQLILPHPRLQDRAFVLVPLCDVAPDWMHPRLRQTAQQLRDLLPADELAEITPF